MVPHATFSTHHPTEHKISITAVHVTLLDNLLSETGRRWEARESAGGPAGRDAKARKGLGRVQRAEDELYGSHEGKAEDLSVTHAPMDPESG